MGISVVGITSAETTTGLSITIPLPLAGEGDVVWVSVANRSTANQTFSEASGLWTKEVDLYGNGVRDTNYALFRKVMGPTPDASLTIDNTVSIGQLAMAWALHEVDPVTPNDAAPTTAVGTNTGNINSPAIVPVTNGAWVISAGGSSIPVAGVTITEPGGYTNIGKVTHSTIDLILAASYLAMGSPASENPANYNISGSSANESFCAVSLAVRPQFPSAGGPTSRQRIVAINKLLMR